jgi:hypothetical protein
MNPRAHSRRGRAALGGVASGIVAGLFLTLMMTAMSLARGNDVWYGIKGAAAPFLGARAMAPGFDLFAVWLGLMIHLAISVAWALPFAFLFYGLRRGATILAGAAWGIVVWLGMFYLILPAVGLEQMQREAPVVRAIVYHLFFGVAVAIAFLGFQRAEAGHVRRLHAAYGT